MKKILTVSLVAMMAVTAARADIASKAYVDSGAGHYVESNKTAGQNIKALDDQVYANTGAITTLNASASTEGSVAKQIADAITASNTTAGSTYQAKSAANYNLGNDEGGWTALTAAEQSAIGSGIDSTKVAQITTNAGNITTLMGADTVAGSVAKAEKDAKAYADSAIAALDLANTYQAKGNYATAAQGDKADTALQPTAASGTTGTKLVEYDATTGLVTGGQAAGTMATANTSDYYNKTDIGTITSGKTLVEMINDASDVDNFISQTITEGVEDKAPSEDAVHGALALKANTNDLGDLAALDEVAESNLATALASKINGKADAATTLAGYNISDAYTKAEADAAFDAKNAASTVESNLNAKIGTVATGKTVVEMISDAQTAATPGIATTSATGVVKGGGNVAIANDGTLSVDLSSKLDANSALASAGTSNSIVTYDTKGLVTGGTAAGALATLNAVGSDQITDSAVTIAKLSASLPSDCQASGSYDCVLKSTDGALGWERIARASGE